MIIGLYLRHVKAYKGICFIPVGLKYNFTTYAGENGVGKSTILEAFNSYFNGAKYPINQSALNDGIKTVGNEPFIAPIFLIEKSKVSRQKKEFDKVSTYFWDINKSDVPSKTRSSMNEFFELRKTLLENGYSKSSHYLMLVGESDADRDVLPKPYFASFHGEESFVSHLLQLTHANANQVSREKQKEILKKELLVRDWKKFFIELKSLYSYVYFPVELDAESFTKIETTEMQKIFDKDIKKEIEKSLKDVNIDKKDGINKILENFVLEIEDILENEYCYHTGKDRNNAITKNDLVNKILEVYFQKRILNKKDGVNLTKISELSAGEKRQALINLVYAFLKRNSNREKMVIIGIDEPENSLHTALCYEQFEKLKEISLHNQILITTHWYGFLPIVSEGHSHFLNTVGSQITFESYDLYDYKAQVKKDIEESKYNYPKNFVLKSTYDLVQSIFYSIRSDNAYNWILCEGISEKIYFEYFFQEEIKKKKLKILPLGGQRMVIRLYKYLETPISEDKPNGKVYCVIDTDITRCENLKNDKRNNLKISRLSNKNSHEKTHLLDLANADTSPTDIEQALEPCIFLETIRELTGNDDFKYQNTYGNTSFIKNFKNLELEDYFKENLGENKILFAKKYVEICSSRENEGEYFRSQSFDKEGIIPEWIYQIKNFFDG
ncbi:hypothetical protein CJF42_15495 [Pseudoalteromonas sp. NBT06-2]|uniref:AAA family ATPase n=1 Tax=Pseudoalteromonas sp. NBT06-2 TaxID=2025950 RepID=UPI000BA503B3|nr:AAA family ATPase [Pseudoalteromonas sp. NBT06-2]PAJ73530.1 hypothetical protein CJF42_15495 [Pseudoalteromonas sp. NBT06-2]